MAAIVDKFSKLVEAFPCAKENKNTVVKIPSVSDKDHGPQKSQNSFANVWTLIENSTFHSMW